MFSLWLWRISCLSPPAIDCYAMLSHVQLFATLWTVACQVPLSMEFFRQECWSWVAIPFSRVCFQPRDRTQVSCIAGRFFTSEPSGKPYNCDTALHRLCFCFYFFKALASFFLLSFNVSHLNGHTWLKQLEFSVAFKLVS